MLEGLYKVQFQTPLGLGSGVVYAKDGRLWGGDSIIYYIGTYDVRDNQLTAIVSINKHSNISGFGSVFGVDRATITLSGRVEGDNIVTRGSAREAPGIPFDAHLTRLSD